MEESVIFVGSAVITDFPMHNFVVSACFKEQTNTYSLGCINAIYNCGVWLDSRSCIVYSKKNSKQLRALRSLISKRNIKVLELAFKEATDEPASMLKELSRNYNALARKSIRELALRRVKLIDYLRDKCCGKQVTKKIRKYLQCVKVYKLRHDHKLTLKQTSLRLALTMSRVKELWRSMRFSKGGVLVKLKQQIMNKLAVNDFLIQYFDTVDTSTCNVQNSIDSFYQEARKTAGEMHAFSKDYFYNAFRAYGFRYHSIVYRQHNSNVITGVKLQNFFIVYLYFVLFRKNFEMIFIDESSVCPGNFKKRKWRRVGSPSVVRTSMKYEKIMLLAAMSQKELLGFQIVHSSFNKQVFANFIVNVVHNALVRKTAGQQLVLFIDNCPSHHYNKLLEFCRANSVIMFFNLPHESEFNAIEYMWEYLKRPLRRMTTYTK